MRVLIAAIALALACLLPAATASATFPGENGPLVYTGMDIDDPDLGCGDALYRVNPDGSERTRLTQGGSAWEPSVSPDGRWVVYGWCPDDEDAEGPEIRILDLLTPGATPRVLLGPETYAQAPGFTGDGQSVYYVTMEGEGEEEDPAESRVYSIPADGSATTPQLIYSCECPVSAARLSPDGTRLAYVTFAFDDELEQPPLFELRSVDLTQQSPTPKVLDPDMGLLVFLGFDQISISPDGRRVAYSKFPLSVLSAEGELENEEIGELLGLRTVNIDGGEPPTVVTSGLDKFDFAPAFSPDGGSISHSRLLMPPDGAIGQSLAKDIDLPTLLESATTREPAAEQEGATAGVAGLATLANTLAEEDTLGMSLVITSVDGSTGRLVPAPPGAVAMNGDWAAAQPDPPVPPKPPVPPHVDPIPDDRICPLRVARARFLVFRGRDRVRLVTNYRSTEPGRVIARFYTLRRDGRRGRLIGRSAQRFSGSGLFRLPRRVSAKRAAQLRRHNPGFLAELRVRGEPTCTQELKLRLTDLRRIKRQFVWFMARQDRRGDR